MVIDSPLTFSGFAWIDDEDGELSWATREDMEGVAPSDRPDGCTPVIIEITPAEEWVNRKQKDYDYLGDIASQLNGFSAEVENLKKIMKLQGGL